MIIDITGVYGAIVFRGFTSNNKVVPLHAFNHNHNYNNCFFKKLTNNYTRKLGIFNLVGTIIARSKNEYWSSARP